MPAYTRTCVCTPICRARSGRDYYYREPTRRESSREEEDIWYSIIIDFGVLFYLLTHLPETDSGRMQFLKEWCQMRGQLFQRIDLILQCWCAFHQQSWRCITVYCSLVHVAFFRSCTRKYWLGTSIWNSFGNGDVAGVHSRVIRDNRTWRKIQYIFF